MEVTPNTFIDPRSRVVTSFRSPSQQPEDWLVVRAARVNRLLRGMPRVNLLLMGVDSVIQEALEIGLLDLHEPIATWRPGEPLVLPTVARAGTMILHDVGALSIDDQRRLLQWLDWAAGRTQVVSTTPGRLLPRVESGRFLDTLYYRLNTICLDVSL